MKTEAAPRSRGEVTSQARVRGIGGGVVGSAGALCFASSLVIPVPLCDRCMLGVFAVVLMILGGRVCVALPALSPPY